MNGKTLKLGLAVLALSAGLWAADDPFLGTWKLNPEKSNYNPGPPHQSQIIQFEPDGDGVKSTTEIVDANGNRSLATYTAYYDGKDYPFPGMADFDSTALKRVNPYAADFTNKKAGKVVRTGRREVSKDGNVLTITSRGIDAKGQSFHNVAVYERQ